MRPSEWLTLAFALGLAALTAALRPDGAALRFTVFVSIAAVTVLIARAPAHAPVRFMRDWLPVAEVLIVFLLLQPIIEAAVPWRLDATLDALDARYLGDLVSAWRSLFGRPAAFTDGMYLAYVSYYLLPVVAAGLAWQRGPEAFGRTVFPLLLAFYLTFLGYLLLPASGPRLLTALEARELGGGALSEAVRAFLRAAESTTLDAFPSGHVAIAVVAAACGARLVGRGAAVLLWLWAAAVAVSTVYIHVHYAVDVVAGLALAALATYGGALVVGRTQTT